jgi:hypothetical protein
MRNPLLISTLAGVMLLAAPLAQAQYKVVGPDGKVTYTDRAPSATEGKATPVSRDAARAGDAALPYTLRQVATRFPVTLYTTKECGEACALGRALLARRGVPYVERIAETNEDREAWPRLVGGTEAPVLKVGEQTLRGFAPPAWDETLDLAGYPRQSMLPVNYAQLPAVPLTERRPPPQPERAPLPVVPPADTASGIRF